MASPDVASPDMASVSELGAADGDGADEARVQAENDRLIVVLALGVVLIALLLNATPARDGVSVLGVRVPEVCTAKRLGAECPGCGLTRSFVLGVRLSPEAFRLHPAGPLLLLALVAQVPYRGWRIWRRRRLAAQGLVELTSARRRRVWTWVKGALIASVFVGWAVKHLLLR